MAKLTKVEVANHRRAEALLERGNLDYDERIEVLNNWHEGAVHMNSAASAHFTPYEMAFHLAIEVDARRVLDLCAGIGALSVGVFNHSERAIEEMVMVELNPDYAAVAKRLLPQAEVIVGSVYDKVLMAELATRNFTCVYSNPPFGNNAKSGNQGPRFKGPMDYEVIDIASDLAPMGVFILPQQKLNWAYSGKQGMQKVENAKYERFRELTGIELDPNCGIDTTLCGSFKDVKVMVEIATADFTEARARRQTKVDSLNDQLDIFGSRIAA